MIQPSTAVDAVLRSATLLVVDAAHAAAKFSCTVGGDRSQLWEEAQRIAATRRVLVTGRHCEFCLGWRAVTWKVCCFIQAFLCLRTPGNP